jgi:hypothetical protein
LPRPNWDQAYILLYDNRIKEFFLSSIKYICVNIYMWLKATLNINNYLTTTYWYLDNWQIAIAWIGWRLSIRKFMKYRILLSCYHTTRYRPKTYFLLFFLFYFTIVNGIPTLMYMLCSVCIYLLSMLCTSKEKTS